MVFVLAGLAVVAVAVIALVVIGRETNRLVHTARPAVFVLEEAVAFIADDLPERVAGRLTHDDVRWVLRTDADLLEEAHAGDRPHAEDAADPDDRASEETVEILDPDGAVGRILGRADDEGRAIDDADVVAVLESRMRYLEAIGAIGPVVDPSELDPEA